MLYFMIHFNNQIKNKYQILNEFDSLVLQKSKPPREKTIYNIRKR